MTDAAIQGVGLAIGLEKHFSINDVIETAVSAGVLSGAGLIGKSAEAAGEAVITSSGVGAQVIATGTAATASQYMYAAIESSVISQLIEMSVGTRNGFDVKAVITTGITSYLGAKVGAKINVGTQIAPELKQLQERILQSGTNVMLGTAVSSIIYGREPDLKMLGAQLVGSVAGQYAADTVTEQLSKLTQQTDATSKPKTLSNNPQRSAAQSKTNSSARKQQMSNAQMDRKLEEKEASAHGGSMGQNNTAQQFLDDIFIEDTEGFLAEYKNLPLAGLDMNDPALMNASREYLSNLARARTAEPVGVANNQSSFWNGLVALSNSKTIDKFDSMVEGITGIVIHPINTAKGVASFLSISCTGPEKYRDIGG